MVRGEIASVNNWISESFVRIVNTDLRSETPQLAIRCPSFHRFKVAQVVFNTVVSVL